MNAQESCDSSHEGGLARAVGTEHRYELAWGDPNTHPSKREYLPVDGLKPMDTKTVASVSSVLVLPRHTL